MTKRLTRPNESAGPGGLLFPNGPTRRDHRPLLYFVLGGAAVAAWFTLGRRQDLPAPAMALAASPPAAVGVITPPAAPAVTRTPSGERPPETWEELRASRAEALAAIPQPAPAPSPEATEPADEPASRPQPRREPARREVARQRAPDPPPAPPVPAVQPANTEIDSESAAPGRLTISSTPWGQLIVDGRLYGNTPRLGLPIAVGQRRLRVAREGFEAFDTTITVEPGAAIRLTGIRLREQP